MTLPATGSLFALPRPHEFYLLVFLGWRNGNSARSNVGCGRLCVALGRPHHQRDGLLHVMRLIAWLAFKGKVAWSQDPAAVPQRQAFSAASTTFF